MRRWGQFFWAHRATWSQPVQVNDPAAPGDTFQQKVFAAPSGKFGVAFYDRRLPCPPNDPIPADVGLANICIDVSVQFYDATGTPLGANTRATLGVSMREMVVSASTRYLPARRRTTSTIRPTSTTLMPAPRSTARRRPRAM